MTLVSLSQVPGVYSAAAKRKINMQVYSLIYGNTAKIFDGKTLFNAAHGNQVTHRCKAVACGHQRAHAQDAGAARPVR